MSTYLMSFIITFCIACIVQVIYYLGRNAGRKQGLDDGFQRGRDCGWVDYHFANIEKERRKEAQRRDQFGRFKVINK